MSGAGDNDSLTEELQLQQRFIKAYSVLEHSQPERLRRLEVRMIRFEEELEQAGVDPEELSAPSSTLNVFWRILKRSTMFLLMLGPAALGTVVHYPAYRLGGYLSTKLSQNSEDVISTIKIISAMLLFPLDVDCCGSRLLYDAGMDCDAGGVDCYPNRWVCVDHLLRRAG